MNRIFVYGTLMREGARADLLGAVGAVEPAWTSGRLYHLPYGYPALVDTPDGVAHGELIETDDLSKRLSALDDYEGDLYRRVDRSVHTARGAVVRAWCYVVDAAREEALLAEGAVRVDSGRWLPGFARSE